MSYRLVVVLAVSLTIVWGCSTQARRGVDDAGGGGADTGGGGTDAGGIPDVGSFPDLGPLSDAGPLASCEARASLVYLVDRNQVLSSYDPRTGTITDIGHISCASASLRPFSMSIDQHANAWVLFDDGLVRIVSTLDASCGAGTIMPGAPFERFGMGFTSEGGGTEALYIAGGTYIDLINTSNPAVLGRIDSTARTTTGPFGMLRGWPELTGNLDGQLFGFYPSTNTFGHFMPGRVELLDTASAAATQTWTLDAMTGSYTGQFAFAFWGGGLYVFVMQDTASTSEIWRFELPPMGDGTVHQVVPDAGRTIVGAGVSICAPIHAPI
jgi:hypothetical protein